MPAAAPAPETVKDPIADLAVLLRRWRLRPKRSTRWLNEFLKAFQEREPDACARYQRVAALGTEMARLLDLSPSSQAAIRGSALLSSLTVAVTNPASNPSKRTVRARGWEKELRGWRWLQFSDAVVQGQRTPLDGGRTTPQYASSPIETRILAVAESFEELTVGRGGVLRGLRALRDGNGASHDRQLVELLWSEDGQAACDRVLRRRGIHHERAVKELEESVRLLGAVKSGRARPGRRQTAARPEVPAPSEPASPPESELRPEEVEETEEESATLAEPVASEPALQVPRETTASPEVAAPSEPASPPESELRPEEVEESREESEPLPEPPKSSPVEPVPSQTPARLQETAPPPTQPASRVEGAAQVNEVEERREDMSKSAASEEQSTKTRHSEDGDSASLSARITAAAHELEEIRAAASRGLEALASVGPAMEELSSLVSRLQASLLPAQDGDSAAEPRQQQNDQQSIALRVERSKGDLDSAEVVDALDALSNLRDVRVREEGSSWAVLRARTDPDTDLAILQAKVAGSLTRRLRTADNGEPVEVTILEGE